MTTTDGAEIVGVEVEMEGRDPLDPGDVTECKLRFWASDVLPLPIRPGTSLWLLEGAKTVAAGEVLPDEHAEDS